MSTLKVSSAVARSVDSGTGLKLRVVGSLAAVLLAAAAPAMASWPNNLGGLADDQIHAMTTDADGNVYVVGQFEGSGVFGSEVLESEGQADVFVAKFDSSGKTVWASRGGGAGIDRGLAIALDQSGTPYVTGVFSRTANFEGGLTIGLPKELPDPSGDDDDTDNLGDIFIGKLDPNNGSWQWLAEIEDDGFPDKGLAIAFLPGSGSTPIDSVVVSARTACPRFFDEDGDDQGNLGLSCNAADTKPNIVLASIDTLGTWNWAFSSAGSAGTSEWVTDLVVDSNGDLYAVGQFTADTSIGGTPLVLLDVPGSTATAVLEFEHSYDFLCCLDAARLQFSQNGGGWTDIGTGRFLANGYDDGSRNVWGGYGIRSAFTTRIDLSDFTSSSIRFRWVFSDASEAGISAGENGWFVDDIRIRFGDDLLLEEGFDTGNGPFSLAGQWTRRTDCASDNGCRGMDPPLMHAYDGVVTSTEYLTMNNSITIPGDPNYFVARIVNAGRGTPEWSWARGVDPALAIDQVVVGAAGGGGNELKMVGTALASSLSPVVSAAGAFVTTLPLSGSSWGPAYSLGSGRGHGIAVEANGSIVITGTYAGTPPGGLPSEFPIVNGTTGDDPPVAGDDDVFVAKFDSGFSPLWLATGGDPGEAVRGPDRGKVVAVYDDGVVTQVFLGGEFTENATFYESVSDTQTLTSYGNSNVFMHNLDGQDGAWFFLGLQTFFAGKAIEPPTLALITDEVLSRPVIEFDAPGADTDYFFWSPPSGNPDGNGRLYALQPVEAKLIWRRVPPGGRRRPGRPTASQPGATGAHRVAGADLPDPRQPGHSRGRKRCRRRRVCGPLPPGPHRHGAGGPHGAGERDLLRHFGQGPTGRRERWFGQCQPRLQRLDLRVLGAPVRR